MREILIKEKITRKTIFCEKKERKLINFKEIFYESFFFSISPFFIFSCYFCWWCLLLFVAVIAEDLNRIFFYKNNQHYTHIFIDWWAYLHKKIAKKNIYIFLFWMSIQITCFILFKKKKRRSYITFEFLLLAPFLLHHSRVE